MEIIFKSYHGIDVVNNSATEREITEKFDPIIHSMLGKILGNPSEKKYETKDHRAVVANIIKEIVEIDLEQEDANEQFDILSSEIAKRLLDEEKKVEQNMQHLKGVQKGSLIQALVKDDSGACCYLIAKVEHSKYIDEIELELKGGFNPEENKIWKTAIFTCSIEEDYIDVSKARIYLNNPAVYWTRDFLELTEKRSDATNTKNAWKCIETVLKNNLKASKPSDYFTLRNAVIAYFRRPRTIVYDDMINDIFNDFEPMNASTEDISKIKEKLLALPGEKDFDTNFVSKPKEITSRIKSVHKVNNDIELIIREGLAGDKNNYSSIIHSNTTAEGERQIIIKATETDTFNMFKLK
ncbi:nucleoid-associated protein [Agathobacter ruminis]|jgi:hypothetical protein|uniref:37-kD nucleoid-associated bacterial protein n=1 Tax=Agathobacter ruminis TaxID=1712665 RepID=A0A2G3E5V8_9FIRM|nr:nucleoid-associated protein [Agathobacter ruminis]MDC7301648.1 nucleoid-associated protein [Agathobacter ruminis]PHU38662.1 hypothetical protein CSX02_01570 [Agathobacter ruminis]